MEWKLINVIQETNHPFLNYFTLTYEVTQNDSSTKNYSYFICSRRKKDDLVSVKKDYSRTDGVLIPLYFINPKTGLLSTIITTQFRPALNNYVYSIPAGLVDNNEDLFLSAKREALEEVGANISNLELLAKSSPTSSGLSDELNSIVLAKIDSFSNNNLEEFEDIKFKIVAFKDLEEYLKDKFVALQVQIIFKYLLLRFKDQY